MKRNLIAFFSNILLIISLTAGAVLVAPEMTEAVGLVNIGAAAVYSPILFAENIKNSDNTAKSVNNSITASEEEQKNTSEDSKVYSDIKQTPSDIKKLMSQAEKTIKKEKKKGKTSEEDYFGGGELISFNDLEIQSKIPASFYKPDIESLLKQKAELSIKDMSKPTILIYHSHTTEGYSLLDVGYYTKSSTSHSDDLGRTVVRVGDDLCSYLEAQGFKVIHDREIHDASYNSSYASSRKTVEKYLEEYPSIDITIDVHRDDITYKNATKVKPTAKVDGKKAARMMIIAGAQYGMVQNHPDWESNLRFDVAVQNKVCSLYPDLMRPILFSERKYNMDLTKNSFLLEVGTDANTLDEACYSARLFATALGELLKEDYVEKQGG